VLNSCHANTVRHPSVLVEAEEPFTGAYVCTRQRTRVPVFTTTSFRCVVRGAMAACARKHHVGYEWQRACMANNELHVYAAEARCSRLSQRYTRVFRRQVRVSRFGTAERFDLWARARCIWPYVAASVVAVANATAFVGSPVHFSIGGARYDVQHAAELVYPSPSLHVGPLRAHLDVPIVVHTPSSTTRYTHTRETHVVLTTACGSRYVVNPCPQYSHPYARSSRLTASRMPDGPSLDRVLAAYLGATHSGLAVFKQSDTYKAHLLEIDGVFRQTGPKK